MKKLSNAIERKIGNSRKDLDMNKVYESFKIYGDKLLDLLDIEEFMDASRTPESLEIEIINIIKSWNVKKSLSIIVQFMETTRAQSQDGAYTTFSERDLQLATYYIFKFSEGSNAPKEHEIDRLGELISLYFLSFNKHPNDPIIMYLTKNGEMFDLHMYFLLERLYGNSSSYLLQKKRFSVKTILIFSLLVKTQKIGYFFTIEDLKCLSFPKYIQKDLIEFVKFLTLEVNDSILINEETFRKSRRRKPLLKLDDKVYFIDYHFYRVHLLNLIHYLIDTEEYKEHRGSQIESITAELFKFYLPDSKIYKNLKFTKTFRGQRITEGDIDVLVETSSEIIIIECKGAPLYDDYKYGKTGLHVERNLNSIIYKAEKQLNKNEHYLVSRNNFLDTHNNKITINHHNREIIKVCICMNSPYGKANIDTPGVTTLSLVDLMVIFDLLYDTNLMAGRNRNFSDIISYLKKRASNLGTHFSDEFSVAIHAIFEFALIQDMPNNNMVSFTLGADSSRVEVAWYYETILLQKIFGEKALFKYDLIQTDVAKSYFSTFIIEDNIFDDIKKYIY